MIKNFEEYTVELKPFEEIIAEKIASKISKNIGKKNAVTNKRIIETFAQFNIKLNEAKVRKMIQFIRQEGLCPNLCATSSGYFCAETEEELEDYIEGLQQRLNSIAFTLQCFKKHKRNVS